MVPHYRDIVTEDPYLHIQDLFDLCKMQNIHGLNAEGIRLILFPFSLKDNAKLWLNSLTAWSIHSWEKLAIKLVKKLFPSQRTRQLRRKIQTFQQKDGDLFFEAWDSAYGGVPMEKNSEEAIQRFETLSENSQQFSSRGRQGLKGNGIYEVNIKGGVQTQIATMKKNLDMLVKAMKKLRYMHMFPF